MVKFIKSAPGYAYFVDDVATLTAEQEAELIKGKFAVKHTEKAIKKTVKKPRTATKKI